MSEKESVVEVCATKEASEAKEGTTGTPVSSTVTTGDPHSSPSPSPLPDTVNNDDARPSPSSSHHHRHRSHTHRHRHSSPGDEDKDQDKDQERDKDRHRSRSHHHHHHHRHHSHRRKERSASRSKSSTGVTQQQEQQEQEPPRKRRSGWDQPGAGGAVERGPVVPPTVGGVAGLAAAVREDTQRRSVYVGGVPPETTEVEVRSLFAAFGPVVRVELARDPCTGALKGYGFVDFATEEAATAVLAITSPLLVAGRELRLGRPHQTTAPTPTPGLSFGSGGGSSGDNTQQQQQEGMATGQGEQQQQQQRSCRIFVGNVAFEVGEAALREIFAQFGTVLSCTLVGSPEAGHHRGYGFLEFDSARAAEHAIAHMNGALLLNRALRVGPAAPQAAPLPPGALLAPPGASAAASAALQPPREASLSSEENLTITPAQRLLLMQSLARDTPLGQQSQQGQQGPQSQEPVGATGAAGIVVAVPPVVVLENLLPPGVAADAELPGEVRDECSRYGAVAGVVAHADGAGGSVRVFVRFGALAAAETAVQHLNGRYFGGRVIAASLVSDLSLIARVGV